MVKTEELRIGNLVLNTDGITHQINALYSGSITSRPPNSKESFEQANSNTYSPIPLCIELLEEFGFRKTAMDCWIKRDVEIWYAAGRFYSTEQRPGINTNYVHRLQNLYFNLTGEELTLNE